MAREIQHRVLLSNGSVLIVEEGEERLHLALEEEGDHPGEVEYYVATIEKSGVLVMTNSGDAVVSLTAGLTGTHP
jgi:hypothetical protein